MLRLSYHAQMMEQRLRIEKQRTYQANKYDTYITNTSFNIFFSRKDKEKKHKECLL